MTFSPMFYRNLYFLWTYVIYYIIRFTPKDHAQVLGNKSGPEFQKCFV